MPPVIHARPFQGPVIELEPERLDQVEHGLGRGAQPGDCAGVGRNLGLDQNDLKVVPRGHEPAFEIVLGGYFTRMRQSPQAGAVAAGRLTSVIR